MLHAAIFAWNFFSVMPFWDIWNWIEDYQTYFNGHYTFHDLIKPHNEHRIATTRLVLFVDGWLCDMTGRFTVTLNFLLLIMLGCLLGHLASPRGISRLRSAAYSALAVAWTTSTCQWIDLVLPFQIQFAFLCLSIVAAAASLARATSPLLTQGWAAIWAGIAGLCYLAGVFSMAGGMLALPSLIVLLVARRARVLPAASFCLVAAASVFLFLFQYHPPPVEPPTLPVTPSKALTLLQFAAQFLGAAFYGVATLPLIAGSAALATYGVAAFLIVRDFTSRRFGISGRLHIAFATAGSFIVIAFAAGVARASGGMAGSIEPRYALVSLLFLGSIVCLPMLLTPSGGRANWRFPRATQAVGATLFACVIVICNGLPRYGREARSFHDGLAANADAMRRNVFVPNLFGSMFYGQPAELSARLAFLAKHHLSVFAPSASPDPPSLSQKPAAQNVKLPGCAGHFDLLYPEDESRSILRGWLASPAGKRSADWIEPVRPNGSTAVIIPVSQDRGAVRVDGHKIHSIEGIYTGIAQPAESAGGAPIVAAIGLFRDRPDLTCLYHMPAPAGAWRVQTRASIGKTFPAIPAGSAAITGGFRVNGVNGMAKLFAPFSNQALYATAAAGDQAEGEVSFSLAPKPGEDIVVPFATGPDVTGQGIAVGFADGTRSEIAVPYDYRVESEWRAMAEARSSSSRRTRGPAGANGWRWASRCIQTSIPHGQSSIDPRHRGILLGSEHPDLTALPVGLDSRRVLDAMAHYRLSPRPAIAVSGGADSLALALLTRHWCGQAGDPLALIVDHGLRPASGAEARLTAERLHAIGIPSRILKLSGLTAGAGLAVRARDARYRALIEATAQSGRVDLLLGHHRADQAETLLMRRQARSGDTGLACMASIRETPLVRLLRPLLGTPPGVLRAILSAAGIGWIEDPSNQDQATLRARLRRDLDNPEGAGPQIGALADQAARHGQARAAKDGQIADELAARAAIFPEGFALLTPGQISAQALGALIRALSGARYGPFGPGLARLAAEPLPAVLGGIRLLPAGRLGPGLLLVREPAAIAPPIPAMDGAVWDRRFRLQLLEEDGGFGGLGGISRRMRRPAQGTSPPAFLSLALGALGADAAALRDRSPLPAAVLHTLPALRRNGVLVEVPHIGYRPPSDAACAAPRVAVRFAPADPASGAPFGV